jgi:hypothetical protein
MKKISLLSILLAGCAGTPEPVVIKEFVEVPIERVQVVPVPEALLTPCVIEILQMETNEDMEMALIDALIELQRCTQDKNDIRALK